MSSYQKTLKPFQIEAVEEATTAKIAEIQGVK